MDDSLTARSACPSVEAIRTRFPGIEAAAARSWALLENAGGSQVPIDVTDAMRAHMHERYVQLGAGYPMSVAATETVELAHAFVNLLVNGTRAGSVVLGPSSTQLCHMLAGCYGERWRAGDEVVVAESGHEGNIGPWLRLRRWGATIRWWRMDPDAGELTVDGLEGVLGERTRIVAFPHVSNLLGGILDVAEIARLAHRVGARVVVDGVAFAPHRAIDVERWEVDWYVYSTYKVYGPHMAAMFGRTDALAELDGPNHFFIPRDRIPYVFELGGACHEGCAGLLGLWPYLAFLAGGNPAAPPDRATIVRAFERMAELEGPLQRRCIDGLLDVPGIRLVGSPRADIGARVPTVSFLHDRRRPSELVSLVHRAGVAIRSGHMYSHRLCEAFGISADEGVVRASAVHYNSVEEIDRLLDALAGA